jgi:pimeloyl-ACP methyl ester carboxylesterase
MVSFAPEEAVARVAAPVLVLRGGRDPIAGPAWVRRLRDAAPHGRLAEVPGHAHNVQHSAPRTVAALLRAFAATLDDAAEVRR